MAGSTPYPTSGLNYRDFEKLFNQIGREQAANRTAAQRTLTPAMMQAKNLQDLLLLGTKANGERSPFTLDDLHEFEGQRNKLKKEFKAYGAGAPYGHLIQSARQIDVDRANNHVSDGTGLPRDPVLYQVATNVFKFRVKASAVSKHDDHRVKVRLEDWTGEMLSAPSGKNTKNAYIHAVKAAAKGRMSIDCECGRHQYTYRYVATLGGFALKPYEYAYPKIRNPELEGSLCKHVIKCITWLQSPTMHGILAKEMARQAESVEFGKTSARYLTKDELKQQSKARKGKTDRGRVIKAFQQYQRAQKGFDSAVDRLKKENRDQAAELARLKQLARKQRQREQDLRKQMGKLKEKIPIVQRDVKVAELRTVLDVVEMTGGNRQAALQAYQKKNNLTDVQIQDLERDL